MAPRHMRETRRKSQARVSVMITVLAEISSPTMTFTADGSPGGMDLMASVHCCRKCALHNFAIACVSPLPLLLNQ